MSCLCHGSPLVRVEPRRRRPGLFSLLIQLLFIYALFVFGGGTLVNTGHPVAVEVGRLFHVITFIEPTIHWADSSGFENAAHGLRLLSTGVNF